MNYAPQGRSRPVVGSGEFLFAAVYPEHGHIYGQCNGLIEAGAELKWIYDPDPRKVETFRQRYPQAAAARALEEVLDDPAVRLVAAAAIPADRGPLGCRVMQAGKDYFTDKAPFVSLDQLAEAALVARETGRKYMVYYSERLHVESAVFAGQLIEQGIIGRVVQVLGLGPHRLSRESRPAWFWEKARTGGILCDIGSHQVEQFLYYTGAADANVTQAAVGNFNTPEVPGFEDFGEVSLAADNGASGYFRVDWLTPDGLRTWGDGRTFVLGTDGYLEMRKYIDVARDAAGDQLYLVTREGEQHLSLRGQVGCPFFGQLILDSLHRTETAMTQAHAFKAAEISLKAQAAARRIR